VISERRGGAGGIARSMLNGARRTGRKRSGAAQLEITTQNNRFINNG
jgi:hypothetical protein